MMMWAGLYHLYLTSLPVGQFMQSELVLTSSRPELDSLTEHATSVDCGHQT
jgi:hypothetical protein